MKQIVQYHHDNTPAPKIEIGSPVYLFPAEMMTTDEGVVQRKYGLTKTKKVVSINEGSFETTDTVYVLTGKYAV